MPSSRGDPDRLKQAYLNLISNACRYSPEGSVVHVRASAPGGRIVVQVQDRGVGIASQDIPRLFQRFERLHRDELPTVKGTGLGLFITRQIAEAHGGTVMAESRKGQGSTFTIDVSGDARFE
jgi:signal transduction histidine kinase